MRRKEFLDDVHLTIETIEPGLTQRRGISLFERSVCHLQLGRELYDKKKFGKSDFATMLEAEIASLNDCLDCMEHLRRGSFTSPPLLPSLYLTIPFHLASPHLPSPNSVPFSVSKYLEDIVFKANAARDDAESWLSQLLDDKL